MTKVRKTAYLKALARNWTAWDTVEVTDAMRAEHKHLEHCSAIKANSRFEVQMFSCNSAIGGVWQLGIIRHGDIEAITWEEIQRIVHELFDDEAVAVEVYPALQYEWKSKANLRVVWVLPTSWPLPFGLEKSNAWGKPTA